jgi:hypothetical protein
MFVITGQYAVHAQGPGGGFGDGPNSLHGTVTAVDTTANTITIQGRGQDATSTTVSVNSTTKYTKQSNVPLTTIAVGNILVVMSRDTIDSAATSVDAFRIQIVDALPKPGDNPNSNFADHIVAGTVLTASPSLTIKNAAGATITVTTSDDTQVSQTVDTTLAAVAVGNNVRVETSTSGSTVTAVAVHIVPARVRRNNGGGGNGGGGGGAAIN